jgi:hypothetical protein
MPFILRLTLEDGTSLLLTEGGDALTTETIPDATGTGANTLDALTSTASGGVGAKGTSASTLLAATSTATGRVAVTGTSLATLATIVSTASGHVTIAGPSAVTLSALTSTATGHHRFGTAANTLSALTSTAQGGQTTGTSAVTLSALTSTASGARGNAGTSAATLTAATSSAAGALPPNGTGASVLNDFYQLMRASAHGPNDGLGTITHTFTVGANLPTAFEWGGDVPETGTIVEHPDPDAGTTGAIQFPDIGNSQETYFEFWAWATPTNNTLTVRYETDSEGGFDFLRVNYQTWSFDGTWDWGFVEQGSGEGNGWQEFTTTLDEGDTRIQIQFFKDSSVSEGADTAWISTLVYPYGDLSITGTGSATLGLLTSVAVGRVAPRRVRRISLHGSTYLRIRAA